MLEEFANGRGVGQYLGILMYHEGNPVGQIGSMRRQIGIPGAIR
jgi:hypothetical protein